MSRSWVSWKIWQVSTTLLSLAHSLSLSLSLSVCVCEREREVCGKDTMAPDTYLISIYIHTHTCTYIHVHTYYMYMYTHTHIHVYMYTWHTTSSTDILYIYFWPSGGCNWRCQWTVAAIYGFVGRYCTPALSFPRRVFLTPPPPPPPPPPEALEPCSKVGHPCLDHDSSCRFQQRHCASFFDP